MTDNLRILLKSRPQGRLRSTDFEVSVVEVPAIGDGQVLLKNLYLSLDPAMRGWVRDAKSYIEPVGLGEVMRGGTVAVVVESKHPDYQPGDKVLGLHGWQQYALLQEKGSRKLPSLPGIPLSNFLGVLGLTGLTAYFGLLEVGKPAEGETVLVSTAAGAVGSIVAQIAKIKGCRVVGIAGSDDKCSWLTGELGLDAAINYKKEDLSEAVPRSCPDGVDVYFDNVGGDQLNVALAHINKRARVVICGAISVYNNQGSPPPGPSNYLALLIKSARMEGFIVFDYASRYAEGAMQLAQWLTSGQLKHREHIVEGLEKAPAAVSMLFDGTNDGKLIVKIADE